MGELVKGTWDEKPAGRVAGSDLQAAAVKLENGLIFVVLSASIPGGPYEFEIVRASFI
jgi:hypothetical protein